MNQPITAAQAHARSLEVNSMAETLGNIWGSIRQAMDQGLYAVPIEIAGVQSEEDAEPYLSALNAAGFSTGYYISESIFHATVNWSSPVIS